MTRPEIDGEQRLYGRIWWQIKEFGAGPFELVYGLFVPDTFLPPRYLDDDSAVASDSFVLVALYQMNLYQGDRKLSVGDTIWNRPSDPPLIAVYDPDSDHKINTQEYFDYKLPDEELAHINDANSIQIHWINLSPP